MGLLDPKQAPREAIDRLILFRIARDIGGMTVDELERTITEDEFGEWCALYFAEVKAQEHRDAVQDGKNKLKIGG